MPLVLKQPLTETLPPPQQVRVRLGEVLREADLLRGLLRLSEKAQEYRRPVGHEPGGVSA